MSTTQSGQPRPSAGGFRLASPKTARVLGVVALILFVAFPPLVALAGRFGLSTIATPLALEIPYLAVGYVVARRQPHNPLGWTFLIVAGAVVLAGDSSNYAWAHYGHGHYALPLGPLAVLLSSGGSGIAVAIPFAILIFPSGDVPSPRWRWVRRTIIVGGAAWAACLIAAIAIDFAEHGVRVESPGGAGVDEAVSNPSGWFAVAQEVALVALALIWVLAAASQVANWRASTGELRQQIKCLVAATGVCLVAIAILASGTANGGDSVAAEVWSQVPWVCFSALPVGIGVGILRYRLYEIDRLISRTVSYLILTGLLVGVFVGVVGLATDVLPFSSPVAVAASTLAAAALFNPLRRRVQHFVDRRFNRARYDAEAIVSAFTLRLRDAIDLDTVQHELLAAVDGAVRPAHASVWIRPPVSRSPG